MTLDHPIGVDIEKVQPKYNQDIAERFFSADEAQALSQLSAEESMLGFYRVWSRKEAILKATGKGLSIPLSAFSVSVKEITEMVVLENNQHWTLIPLSLYAGYQSAVATNQPVKKIVYWSYLDQTPRVDKVAILS